MNVEKPGVNYKTSTYKEHYNYWPIFETEIRLLIANTINMNYSSKTLNPTYKIGNYHNIYIPISNMSYNQNLAFPVISRNIKFEIESLKKKKKKKKEKLHVIKKTEKIDILII